MDATGAPTLDAAIDQAMAENMLEFAYRSYVVELLGRADDDWRICCNSNCEPCMLQLGRVVDRVRVLTRS